MASVAWLVATILISINAKKLGLKLAYLRILAGLQFSACLVGNNRNAVVRIRAVFLGCAMQDKPLTFCGKGLIY